MRIRSARARSKKPSRWRAELNTEGELDFEAEHRVGHLLRRAYHRAKGNTTRLLKQVGITPMQAATLMTLHRRGPLSQADLGRAIGMEPANVHGLVARLRKQQLIDVEPHPSDQRQVRVALSAEGERHADTIAELSLQSATETLEPLTPAEREQLMELLGRIALE
jgi:DNA-binding MarR family transcriptional regulator